MRGYRSVWVGVFCVWSSWATAADSAAGSNVPKDFPRFVVPGREETMASLRVLYDLHYRTGRPLATLWDEWMVGPTLWPAVKKSGRADQLRKQWRQTLLGRRIDAEGYVATHQHASIAHQDGWPFPFWAQGGRGAWGWHFSLKGVPAGWHSTGQRDQKGWVLTGGQDAGIENDAWNIDLRREHATVETPVLAIQTEQSPFLQLRWRAKGLGNAQPYVEWTTKEQPEYEPDRRFYFSPVDQGERFKYTMIPVHRSPAWTGEITRLRINFNNPVDAQVGIQAFFTQYDTRHNINNQAFIIGSDQYFRWTRDLNFLRANINRMRLALVYVARTLGGWEHKCVVTPYVGHCGRSGLKVEADDKRTLLHGRGIGNNYWDLLPMGKQDAYATIRYYAALNAMAALERDIKAHPEWNIPDSPLRQIPEDLAGQAAEVKRHAGQLFWNEQTGRFVCGIDVEGQSHDYGFTFLNCEAIHYGFATRSQAERIMAWISGERSVEGDTSQGADIYHWRFGPRATTKRNVEYYGWFWTSPQSIPWGGQVQDGGAVLGFSYHDLTARLHVYGPDNVWQRLQEIVAWFEEVQAAGGYRAYYKDGSRGTLQGGGTAGGLGCDKEFFESILVPQIMLDGFLGFKPRSDGCEIRPALPADWPKLTVTEIYLHDHVLNVSVEGNTITITPIVAGADAIMVYPVPGQWAVEYLDRGGQVTDQRTVDIKTPNDGIRLGLKSKQSVRLSAHMSKEEN